MSRTPAQVQDLSSFDDALHLFPTVEAAVENNVSKLHACRQPIAFLAVMIIINDVLSNSNLSQFYIYT